MTNMSTRDQLTSYADRFLKYINHPNMDPSYLPSFLAEDVITPLAYPGAPSGYTGITGIVEKLHGALTDFELSVVSPVVDEKECRVVYFVKSKGVQSGYVSSPPRMGACACVCVCWICGRTERG
jgi:hypothetical protein